MLYLFGGFELDRERFELRNAGGSIAVEPKVLGLLLLLVQERHRAVEKSELLAKNWPDVVVGEASLARAVMEARRAIGDDAHELIVTVRGRGFRFAGEVTEREASASGLVGRSAVLLAIQSRLAAALEGRGNVTWLTGEPGIGRTAVAAELERVARAQGARVVHVQCHDDPPGPIYGPFQKIARECELSVALEGDAPIRERFDRFADALRQRAAHEPLAIVLEDVHRESAATIALLEFASAEIASARCFFLVTFAEGPALHADRRDALRRAVAQGISIPLRPLGQADTALLLERLGVTPTPDVVAWYLEKSGGNPRFIAELVNTEGAARIGERGGNTSRSTDLTEGLRASIEGYVAPLSAGAKETLTMAALLGQSFEFSAIAAVASADEAALLDHLAEATRARLVEKTATGTYRFRHALVRSVLSRALTGTERARTHAAIAERLEAHWASAKDAHAEELAHHWVKALPLGNPQRALEISLAAAEHARLRGARDRAVTHYERALEALTHLRGEPERGIDLHLALGRASENVARAREAFLDAAVLATALRRPASLAEAALAFAETKPERAAAEELLRRASSALLEAEEPRSVELRRALSEALGS